MATNNSSLSFNGIDQYAKLGVNGSVRNLASFAFSAFFKVGDNATSTNQHAYVERQGIGSRIRFRFTPVAGKLQFGFSPKDGVADTSYTYNTKWDDRWHHASFTARLGERSTYEITLDGVTVMSGTLVIPDGVTKVEDTASLGIYMGASSTDGTTFKNYWNGLIDEVAIHSQGLTQGSFTEYLSSLKRWDEQHDPNPPANETLDKNLIVYYPFDENTGTISTDRGSTEVDDPTETVTWYHGPAQVATFYKGASTSSTLWATDRPFLGNGLRDTVIPSTPGSPTTSGITADEFIATWTASTDNVWVQFYELQVSEFADFSTYMSFDTGRSLTKKVTGLVPATNYYWRVRAFDAELNPSGYSTIRSFTSLTSGDVAPPNPPTNLSASFVTHSSFRVSFTHSTSSDAVGYKIDISPKDDFSEFLTGFRNEDIGNGTFTDVFGAKPLTSYYVRMRTYDAYDNESNDSVVLRVNTPRQPDITPPLPANMLDASQVTATSAVLRWQEGIDDTAVVGYYLDVSKTATFADYLVTNTTYWSSVDVGNVTSYRIEGLEPSTQYYYRVRAYDEAGNVASNIEEGQGFSTISYSLYEGGPLESDEYHITWRENDQTEVSTPRVGDSTSLFIEYDLSGVVGTIQNVVLRFMPREYNNVAAVFGSVGIQASLGDITTTPSSDEVEVSITQLDEWVEVDITPIVYQSEKYCILIRSLPTNGYTGYIDMGDEILNFNENNPSAPSLNVTTDPLSSSQPLETDITVSSYYRDNLIENPSFETSDVGWSVSGSGVTMSRELGGLDGDYYLQFSGTSKYTGVIQGTHFVEVEPNSVVSASLDLHALSGGTEYYVYLIGYTNTGSGIGSFAATFVDVPLGDVRRVAVSGTTQATAYRVKVYVMSNSDGGYTGAIDNVTLTKTDIVGSPFNGNSSRARWLGVANESVSRVPSPTLSVISGYIGDSNENNTVSVAFRNAEDTDRWIPIDSTIITDRVLKQHRFTFGPSYGQYNRIINPSFELSDIAWSGGQRVEDTGYTGNFGYSITENPYLAQYTSALPAFEATEYSAQIQMLVDPEVTAHLTLSYYNRLGQLLSSHPSEYVYGDGATWVESVVTAEAPTNTSYALINVSGNGAFMIDAAQFTQGDPKPYRDGDTLDGAWEGNPHESMTGLQLLPETSYDIQITYTDADGLFDADSSRSLVITERVTTPIAPDDVFNAQPFELSANENTIFVVLPYTGDDNEDSTVRMEFKRTDLTTWSELRPVYDRNQKQIITTIPNVKHGTNYTIRAIITDPDGVYGAENNTVVDTINTLFITAEGDTEPLITFGGFVLMGREDAKIGVTGHDAFGFPNRRVSIETLPRLDGAVEMQALWGTKPINMEGFISGDSRADLEEVQRALKLGLAPNKQRLVIDTLSRRGRYYNATCESLQIEEIAEKNVRHLRWSAEFMCADPFAYDISESVVPVFTTPNNGTIAVSNDGDAAVNPVFLITTSSAFPVNVTIINTSTGERIAPKSTIISGNRMIIDAERKSLTKNGVEIDYSGSFPRLAVGGNEFTFELSIARTASSTATTNAKIPPPTINVDMRWRHKYL